MPKPPCSHDAILKRFCFLQKRVRQQALPGTCAPRPCRLGAQHRNSRERKKL